MCGPFVHAHFLSSAGIFSVAAWQPVLAGRANCDAGCDVVGDDWRGDIHPDQAKLTFAMARHAVVDLTQMVNARYLPHEADRLPPDEARRLRWIWLATVSLIGWRRSTNALEELRSLYEPYAQALARRLYVTLPPWIHSEQRKDNWQGGPWDRAIQARALERPGRVSEDHF